MTGKIIINPYKIPGQSVKQAQRLKAEFDALGVDVQIDDQAFLRVGVKDNGLYSEFKNCDFVIYLDKDKYLSQILQDTGVKTFNNHQAIRVCDDKGETYLALAGKGLNLPKTKFAPLCYLNQCDILDYFVNDLEKEFSYPIIVKSSYGSCGNGVFKADDKNSLISIMQTVKTQPHMYQEYLGKEVGKDVRVIVIGGKAIAAMRRINKNDFRSNVALGGYGEKLNLDDKQNQSIVSTAEKCAKVLGLDYCGVDLLKGNDGNPVVCEVNSNAFFEGIEQFTKVNVAKAYAEYVVKTLNV